MNSSAVERHVFSSRPHDVVLPAERDVIVLHIDQSVSWRSRHDGCSGPDSAARVPARRKAAWRRRPSRAAGFGEQTGEFFRVCQGGELPEEAQSPRRRPCGVTPGTFLGTLVLVRAPAGRILADRRSSASHRERAHLPARHNAHEDGVEGFGPMCGGWPGSRSRLRGAWDRQRFAATFRRRLGTEGRKPPVDSEARSAAIADGSVNTT